MRTQVYTLTAQISKLTNHIHSQNLEIKSFWHPRCSIRHSTRTVDNTEAYEGAPAAGMEEAAIGRPAVVSIIDPNAAADNTAGACKGTSGIINTSARVATVPVTAPLLYVTAHVV